jgi:pimeloyl-ACP methyl ester carboxylesterase
MGIACDRFLDSLIGLMIGIVNGGFWSRDDQLLHEAKAIANIPGTIVHGRYDLVCPVVNAWDLHKVWYVSCQRIVRPSVCRLSMHRIASDYE